MYLFDWLIGQIVEPAGNKEEKMLNYDIGIALGKVDKHIVHCSFKSKQASLLFVPLIKWKKDSDPTVVVLYSKSGIK